MLTFNINYDVSPDRLVTIQLPQDVSSGLHELVIALEEQPARAALWRPIFWGVCNDKIKRNGKHQNSLGSSRMSLKW